MKLKDRVVLITDGAVPLGTAIASRFAEEGAVVVLNMFPVDTAGSGGGLVTHADPRSKAQIDEAVQLILKTYGRIDVVVHNNNEVIRADIESCSDDDFDRALDINVKSAFLYVQAAGQAMKEARRGAFVFISSIHDEKPNGAAFGYSVAKGALKMLTKEMVLDLGPYNVRTNIVELGPMEGDAEKFQSDLTTLYEYTAERIQTQRYLTLPEVANAALFFASDDCPSANGADLRLDGGFLLTYVMRLRKPGEPPLAPEVIP
jgi:NAD(P)-dependent dehydrogenase (short-subunit alcohol dehydrogenase family)